MTEAPPTPGPLRRVASALVPAAGKRMIDRARNRRTMSVIAPANRRFVERHGLRVSGGPFAGMEYLPGQEHEQGDLVTKLLGTYESELHEAIAGWRADPPAQVVNVGCAEGYYAVGLATVLPETTRVLAYDIDPHARELCRSLAELNGVGDRVTIGGACTPETLLTMPSDGVGLLSDCEGYELTLLNPDRVPQLRTWSVIVELHDFVDPTITETIRERFAPTHDVAITASGPAALTSAERAQLDFMTPRQRDLVLDERPVSMNWGVLTPSGAPV